MKNLLPKGLVVAAGLAGIPALIAQPDVQPAEKAQIRSSEDPRILSLRRFFEKAQSPAQYFSDLFVREADTHNLDWRLLPGLAFIESGGGKRCRRNNLFGWNNGGASFASFADCIREVARHLAVSRYYRNKSLDALLRTYNRTPGYSQRVKSVMARISPTLDLAVAD